MRLLSALLVVGLLAAPAAAAPPVRSDAARAEAKRLTDLGAEALDRGDYAVALELFAQAYRTFPSPKLHFNVGLALGGIGRYPEAIAEFEAFVEEAKEAPPESRQYAEARLRELEARVGRVTLQVTPADARLTIDRQPAAAAHALALLPGVREVAATRAGYQPLVQPLTVRAGQAQTLSLALSRVRSSHAGLWVGVTLGVLAAAGLAVGLGVGLQPRAPDSSFGVHPTRFQ